MGIQDWVIMKRVRYLFVYIEEMMIVVNCDSISFLSQNAFEHNRMVW